MANIFLTNEYERSHGRTPRGRGGWLFIDADEHNFSGINWDRVISANGTYTEAKREVNAGLRARGISNAYVVVLP